MSLSAIAECIYISEIAPAVSTCSDVHCKCVQCVLIANQPSGK